MGANELNKSMQLDQYLLSELNGNMTEDVTLVAPFCMIWSFCHFSSTLPHDLVVPLEV